MKQSFLCSPDFYLYSRTAFMLRIIFHKTLVTSLLNSYLCQPDWHTQCTRANSCKICILSGIFDLYSIIYRIYIYNGDISSETFICSNLFSMNNIKQSMSVNFYLVIWGLKKNPLFYCFATSLVMWQDTSDVNVNYFYLRK